MPVGHVIATLPKREIQIASVDQLCIYIHPTAQWPGGHDERRVCQPPVAGLDQRVAGSGTRTE